MSERRTQAAMSSHRQQVRQWERHYRVMVGWKDMSLALLDKYPAVFGHRVRLRDRFTFRIK